jgi:hypothetical protein
MRRIRSLAPLLIVVSSAGAVALASAGGEEPQTYPTPADTDRAAVERVSPMLPQLFGEFRRARHQSDRMPGDPVGALQELGDAQPEENPALSRRLDLSGGQHVYAWPMRDGVCYSSEGGGGCIPTALLAEKGVFVGTGYLSQRARPEGAGAEWQLFALARDGISELRVTLHDGSEISRAIQSNGVLITLATAPVEARWQNLDGKAGVEPLAARFPWID